MITRTHVWNSTLQSGLDPDRIEAEAEYFGLDSLLDRLHLARNPEPELPKPAEPKRAIFYSLRRLKVIESISVSEGGTCSPSSNKGPVVTASGAAVGTIKYDTMKAEKNVYFVDVNEKTCAGLEGRVKMMQIAAAMLDNFEHYFEEK